MSDGNGKPAERGTGRGGIVALLSLVVACLLAIFTLSTYVWQGGAKLREHDVRLDQVDREIVELHDADRMHLARQDKIVEQLGGIREDLREVKTLLRDKPPVTLK